MFRSYNLNFTNILTNAGNQEIFAISIASPGDCGSFGSSDGTPSRYSNSPFYLINNLSLLG